MVSITRKTAKPQSLRSSRMRYDKEKLGLASLLLTVGALCAYWLFLTRNDTTMAPPQLLRVPSPPSASTSTTTGQKSSNRRIPELPAQFNGIAKDILQVLNCSQKLPAYYSWNDEMPGFRDDEAEMYRQGKNSAPKSDNKDSSSSSSSTTTSYTIQKKTKDWMDGEEDEKSAAAQGAIKERRRRLAERQADSFTSTYDITAKHLFCLAAGAPDLPKQVTANSFKCPVLNNLSTRKALLNAWSAARAASMSENHLQRVLDITVEQPRDVLGHAVKLWAPIADDGSEYIIKRLGKNVDEGGISGLDRNLGPGKVFVDVGSCLGLTALAVTLHYPGTTVVAVEPASPNWFIMQMNFICNLEDEVRRPHAVLGGVGDSTSSNPNNIVDSQMAKMLWRSSATTMTRAWTPGKDRKQTDIDLIVALRRWDAILKDANLVRQDVDVLNVDCQGCEYNLIPSLTDTEYEAISTVMGNVHWGYIPPDKLPSKERGSITHKRLCKHENFARTAKECCAFPKLDVKSTFYGEALVQDNQKFPAEQATVADVAGELCKGFDEWAIEKKINEERDDMGWFELTSMAAVVK